MVDPLEDIISSSIESHDAFLMDNREIDRAFHNGSLGDLIHSWSNDDDGDAGELEGETGPDVVAGEDGGENGEPSAVEEAV